jgi:hypothetical protein
MSLTYEKTFSVEAEDAEALVAVPAPSRTYLRKLVAIHDESDGSVSEAGDDAFTLDVFNRLLKSDPVDVVAVEQAPNGRCSIVLETPLKVKVGDPVSLDSNAEASYNVVHRVTQIVSAAGGQRLITNKDFTVFGAGGTARLDIEGTEQELYRVFSGQLEATGGLVKQILDDGLLFENQDPRRHDGSSHERKIYLRFGAAGAYRVTLAFEGHESFSM